MVDDMSLPETELALQAHLGDCFVDTDWQPALAAVMDAEGDTNQARQMVDDFYKKATHRSGLKIRIPALSTVLSKPQQATVVEADLMDTILELKSRNRIFGPAPSINDILDPIEERQQEQTETDGSVKGIADVVRREIAVENGEIIEIDDSEDDDNEDDNAPCRADLIKLCQQLQLGCMQHSDPQFSLELSHQLLKFRAILQKEELHNTTQTTLDSYIL